MTKTILLFAILFNSFSAAFADDISSLECITGKYRYGHGKIKIKKLGQNIYFNVEISSWIGLGFGLKSLLKNEKTDQIFAVKGKLPEASCVVKEFGSILSCTGSSAVLTFNKDLEPKNVTFQNVTLSLVKETKIEWSELRTHQNFIVEITSTNLRSGFMTDTVRLSIDDVIASDDWRPCRAI